MAHKEQDIQAKSQARGGVADTYATAAEYSRRIWLAGLGAMSRTGTEGRNLFESLVKEGEEIEARSRERAAASLEETMQKATNRWDHLESLLEERVSRTLSSLGVATNEDIRNLAQQVQQLNEQVKALSGKPH